MTLGTWFVAVDLLKYVGECFLKKAGIHFGCAVVAGLVAYVIGVSAATPIFAIPFVALAFVLSLTGWWQFAKAMWRILVGRR